MSNLDRIKKLEEEKRRIQALLKQEKRKVETRRKILIGIAFLKAIEEGVVKDYYVDDILNRFTTRNSDRAFLGLQSLNDNANDNGHQATVDEIVDDLVAETPSDSSEYSYQ